MAVLRDINFGSNDSRELTLRPVTPWSFMDWTGEAFHFKPWRLFNPLAWFNAAKCRTGWRLECRRYAGSTHRCWCPDGRCIDGAIVLCGFGFVFFYSHYWGEVPCRCDRALAELEAENEEKTTEANHA